MIVFIHVERTAGSSIHSWFHPANVPTLQDRSWVLSGADLSQIAQAKAAPRPAYLAGHFGLADLDAAGFAPSDIRVLFAVTRDPVERAISLYALMRRSPDWLPHIAPSVGDRDFEYFYEFCRDRGYYFPNDQCRRIGGSASFSATRSIIMERYSFVGSSDRIDLVASALRSRLSEILPGFSAPSVRLNGAKYGNDKIALSKRMEAKVEDDESEDAQLHRFIVEEGGLYSRS